MFKIQSILTRFFLIFIVGVGSVLSANAHSSDKALLKNEGDRHSDDQPSQDQPQESFSELDFFGAFSLVNIQLQWRDLHMVSNQEATDAESVVKFIDQVEWVKVTLLDASYSYFISPANVTTQVAFTSNTSKVEVDFTEPAFLNQKTGLIAYILNCGTYPHMS